MKSFALLCKSLFLLATLLVSQSSFVIDEKNSADEKFLSHIVDLQKQNLQLYWKNPAGERYGNFKKLKTDVEANGEELFFAMNGGMYQEDGTPLGLYIENGIQKHKINKVQDAYGNFYMQPNGIFYISNDNKGYVCKTSDFKNENIKFATQSGPMILIDGNMHPKFREGSTNLNIRNGVGVLPNGNLIFAMSKGMTNFYDFATFFKSQGCKNALYLDGFVSKTYLPSQDWNATNGNFGVIIGETKKKE